jgi:hypothetical protein
VESVPPANLNLRGVLIGADGKLVGNFTVFDEMDDPKQVFLYEKQ